MMKIWDLYNYNLIRTEKTILENEKIPEGYYHMALEIWIINSNSQIMLFKNTIDYSKRYPGSWSCLGDNIYTDENITEAVDRILNEKLGVKNLINSENLVVLEPVKRDPYQYAYITCIIFSDFDYNVIEFKDQSYSMFKYVNKKELINMCNNGEIAYYLIGRINDKILDYIK